MGRTLPYLAHTGQVCASEHKVLTIKQSVEFYYFNSKNRKSKSLILICFIILIGIISIVKFAEKRLEQCLFGLEALKRL